MHWNERFSDFRHSGDVSNCWEECGSYIAGGFNAGVVYTSSDPREILRFASGAYAQGNTRISVVLEFKTTPQDLHIDSTPYECAIHLPSVKS